MGNICGINIFLMLLQKYGDDLAKLVAIEKTKQLIEEKFVPLKQQISKKTGKIKQQALQDFDKQDGVLDQNFQKVKKDMNSQNPGGVEAIEKTKGQPFQKVMGLDSFKEQLKQMKKKAGAEFDEQEANLLKKVDQTKDQELQKLEKQKPQIPIYSSLSDDEKKQVMQKGQQQFGQQIKKKQNQKMDQIKDKLDPQTYLGGFKDSVPSGQAEQKVKDATDKFQTLKKTLTGGIPGGLGNLF